MASLRQPGPIGDAIGGVLESGALARAPASRPGVIGVADLRTRAGHAASDAQHPWIAIDLSEGLPEADAAAAQSGRVRIVDANEPDYGCIVLTFRTPAALRDATAKLAEHPEGGATLRAMSGLTGPALADWLAGQLDDDRLKILWRRRSPFVIADPTPEPSSSPAPRRAPAPSAPSPEYTTFPSDFDAAAVAAILQLAAQDGVPFCEECVKARAAAAEPDAGAP